MPPFERTRLHWSFESTRQCFDGDHSTWLKCMHSLSAQLRLESEFDAANPLAVGADLAKGAIGSDPWSQHQEKRELQRFLGKARKAGGGQ
jgi:hypothetical protein